MQQGPGQDGAYLDAVDRPALWPEIASLAVLGVMLLFVAGHASGEYIPFPLYVMGGCKVKTPKGEL